MATKSKVHSGVSKRIKISKNGKMIRRKPYGNHLMSKKSPGRKRNISKTQGLTTAARKTTRRLLGV